MDVRTGKRKGTVRIPVSKSHLHRLLIADYLAGDRSRLADDPSDADDIRATKRCLRALDDATDTPCLDCGESGSTIRFLAPVAAALGKRPTFKTAGRLASRPQRAYPEIRSGIHELPGDVSSQFVTGLLFALPLLEGNSEIRFSTPLESRGYVAMTLAVLAGAGITVGETAAGFTVPGPQRYRPQPATAPEGDWSGAAFWYAMNALGSEVTVTGLNADSAQPDRAVIAKLAAITDPVGEAVDVAQCPDLFPALSVVAAGQRRAVTFTGIRRLRIKECDRVAAMATVLERFGARVEVTETTFTVHGIGPHFRGGAFPSCGDHRIAMATAVGATCATEPVVIDDTACAAKSYPVFFEEFERLRRD